MWVVDDKNPGELIEMKPVVHARWITDEHTHWYRCSNCNRVRPYDTCDATDPNNPIHVYWDCNFCPECGAIMDLESEGRDECE